MIARSTLINARFTTTFGDVFVAKKTRPDISEPTPGADAFFVTTSQGTISPEISFNDASLADWDFGDGTIVLDDNSPSHTYTDGQPSHEVRLQSIDTNKVTLINIVNNFITDVNLSAFPLIEVIFCSNNNISTLDVASLTSLVTLECPDNSISVLDVANLTGLVTLRCGNNNISVLNITSLINIDRLNCKFNNISVLDISNLTVVQGIDCQSNNISILDTSSATILGYLDVSNNNLPSGQIDQILIDLDSHGILDGFLMYTGNPGAPTLASLTAYNNLISKGWTITGPVPA